MKRAVALLGKDEVDDIVRSQGKIEVSTALSFRDELATCHIYMCVSSYDAAHEWTASMRVLTPSMCASYVSDGCMSTVRRWNASSARSSTNSRNRRSWRCLGDDPRPEPLHYRMSRLRH